MPFPALEWLLPLRSRRLRAEATVLRETWNSASQQMATLVLGQYPEANRGNGWSGLPESIFKQCLLSGKVTEEQALRTSCGIALASMDTTSSSMKTVLTAFAYFKDLQRTHQECLDRVCDGIPTEHSETAYPEMLGKFCSRTPCKSSLGADLLVSCLSSAFIRECLRIVPAIPIGIIRETISDMEWRGRKIPAGTLLFPMVQMINRDVDLYGADALEFRPSRFFESLGQNGKGLNSKGTSQLGPLTSQAGFGFGKRACPGADLAEKAIVSTSDCRHGIAGSFLSSLRFFFPFSPSGYDRLTSTLLFRHRIRRSNHCPPTELLRNAQRHPRQSSQAGSPSTTSLYFAQRRDRNARPARTNELMQIMMRHRDNDGD